MSVAIKSEVAPLTSVVGRFAITGVFCIICSYWSGTALADDELPSVKNSIGMELVLIPDGEFQMGSSAEEIAKIRTRGPGIRANLLETSMPVHTVRISSAFYMGRTEVTRKEWKAVMGTEPWKHFVRNPALDGPDFPACNINWEDSLNFCNQLTAIERLAGTITNNQEYRLPTEAEWEYACRAGSQTAYCFGNDPEKLGEYCWWGGAFKMGTASAAGEPYPHKVGQKRANLWGLFDMHGNVSEWCRDSFDESAYHDRKEISIDPIHVVGNRHVYRGGQWAGNAWMSRSAYRVGETEQEASRPNSVHGLRVVRSQ